MGHTTPLTDFLGREVKVGDYIFHSTTGRYPTTKISKVTRLTEKSVFAASTKANRTYINSDEKCVRNTFLIINELIETG